MFRTVPHNINTEQNGTRPARPANILHTALHSAPRYGTVQYRDCHVRRKVVRRHPESQVFFFAVLLATTRKLSYADGFAVRQNLKGRCGGKKKEVCGGVGSRGSPSPRRCYSTALEYCSSYVLHMRPQRLSSRKMFRDVMSP